MVEQPLRKRRVGGSNPLTGSSFHLQGYPQRPRSGGRYEHYGEQGELRKAERSEFVSTLAQVPGGSVPSTAPARFVVWWRQERTADGMLFGDHDPKLESRVVLIRSNTHARLSDFDGYQHAVLVSPLYRRPAEQALGAVR